MSEFKDQKFDEQSAPKTLIFTCSPRAQGNTDAIGNELFSRLNSDSRPAEILPLRSVTIQPCSACGFCSTHKEQCPLEAQDDGGWLFDKTRAAQTIIIVAPIFFYGPPAQLKSFIDRAQKYWHTPNYALKSSTSKKMKPAFTALVAARTKGKRTFEPSLLILRYFLQSIGFSLQEQLLLRGLENPQDFLNSAQAKSELYSFIEKIQNSLQ